MQRHQPLQEGQIGTQLEAAVRSTASTRWNQRDGVKRTRSTERSAARAVARTAAAILISILTMISLSGVAEAQPRPPGCRTQMATYSEYLRSVRVGSVHLKVDWCWDGRTITHVGNPIVTKSMTKGGSAYYQWL